MRLKLNLLFLVLLSVLSSCEVSEGVGGTASIEGSLTMNQYNDDFSTLVSSFPAADEKVYIQYGDSKTVSDDVETSYDGYFKFSYLYEGDYTIYYYSKDSLNPLDSKKEILLEVSVDKGDEKDLGELICLETLDYDEGKATIKGNVYEIYYTYTSVYPNMIPEDTLIANDVPVYIRYGAHDQYDDRIRSQEDGSFYFNDLIPGDYTIYVFSEDIQGSDQQVSIESTVTITSNEDEEYDLGDLFIFNL